LYFDLKLEGKKIMKRIIIGSLLFIVISANAQDYQLKKYRVENGLPSDVIKAVTQDSIGYYWIATDEGLVKYDGIQFTSYKNALHSQYAKGLYKTKKGKLLLFGDLDLVEIINRPDTLIFNTIFEGTRNVSENNLWYPK